MTTPLHRELAERIARLIHAQHWAIGSRLHENQLAELLGVSRTPVRAALALMEQQGLVRRIPRLGVELQQMPALPQARTDHGDTADELLRRIATDSQNGVWGEFVSEKELMAAYQLPRPVIRNALERLADLGAVEPKLGYGWRFCAGHWDASRRHESYRFRMVIEPAAVREPGFSLPEDWAHSMRKQHESFLQTLSDESSSIAFFEMNAAFHEGIAAASGNRFFQAAVERQNRLRRLSNYNWKYGRERMEVNCREHLEILERLEQGDTELAALLLTRHLDVASRLRSPSLREATESPEAS